MRGSDHIRAVRLAWLVTLCCLLLAEAGLAATPDPDAVRQEMERREQERVDERRHGCTVDLRENLRYIRKVSVDEPRSIGPVMASKPVAKTMISSGYSDSAVHTPAGLMRSIGVLFTSTSVTFARLNVSK